MYLKELEYIVKIADEQSLTRAAEKLFITPSALTQQLARIEKDLGTALFFRARHGCFPTEAGEIYIKAAKNMLREKKEIYNQIKDIADTKKGTLSIGFPPEHGASMFTYIYPKFHQIYPDIEIQITETSVRQQQAMISQGSLDIGFLTLLDSQKTTDEYIPIISEELLIALPSASPLCRKATVKGDSFLPVLELDELKEMPFAFLYRQSTIHQWIEIILRKSNFIPKVLFETSRCQTILDVISSNLCCSLISDYYYDPSLKQVSFFCLPDHPTWNLEVSYRKNSYLSKPAKTYIELASEYWRENKYHYFDKVNQ